MNIVLHSVIIVLVSCVTFGYGDILFKPNSGQPGNYGQNGQFGNPGLGQSGLPVQPGYNNQFGQPGQFGQQSGQFGQQSGQFGQQSGQFGQQTGQFGQQPGQFGQQPGQFGQQAGQFGQQPGQFDLPVQPGQFGQQPGQFGLPVQPGQFGQQSGQFEQQSGQIGQQAGQFGLPIQPGYNNQFEQVKMSGPRSQIEQPGMSGSFKSYGSLNNPFMNSVHSEFERYQNLNKELEKTIMEMIKNKTLQVPPNFSQYPGSQSKIPQILLQSQFQNVPQQWSNIRLHRSSPVEIQTLQSQGYQIVKLRDYQNFNQFPKPGFTFSGPNIGNNEQTSDKQNNSSLAENSTLDASKNNSNNQEHKTDLRTASSEDDYIVGSPLQIYKHRQNIEQHHPVGKTDLINTFYSNSSKEQESKDSEFKNPASNSKENSSNFLARNNFTGTNNFNRQSTNAFSSSTKSGQPQLPNDKSLKDGTDGLKKRFGDDYIGLTEELSKNKTELSPTKAPAPAQVLYRAAFNGNPHSPLILSSSTKTMAVPISTSNIYNHNPYNSYTPVNSAGRALYPLSNVWPRYATYNNNYQANLMNSMPRNLINPMNNNFQKKLPYGPSYYYNNYQ